MTNQQDEIMEMLTLIVAMLQTPRAFRARRLW
jgi:alkylhydroperoxidase/carboxymuconolactone decarboxylase family protein YurZ